jgi:hypothetical protein
LAKRGKPCPGRSFGKRQKKQRASREPMRSIATASPTNVRLPSTRSSSRTLIPLDIFYRLHPGLSAGRGARGTPHRAAISAQRIRRRSLKLPRRGLPVGVFPIPSEQTLRVSDTPVRAVRDEP